MSHNGSENQNKRPPFRFHLNVCDGDYEERPQFANYCSSRTQTVCLTERKTGLQQHDVKICKYGICMEYGRFFPFHTSNFPFHSILESFHIPYRFFLPFHTTVCPANRHIAFHGNSLEDSGVITAKVE